MKYENVVYQNEELGIVIDEWFNDGEECQGEVYLDTPFGQYGFTYNGDTQDGEIVLSDHSYHVRACEIKALWTETIRDQLNNLYHLPLKIHGD